MDNNDIFFLENDKRVNNKVCRILLWMTIIFPTLFLLSAVGVFQVSFKELAIVTPFGLICTITPTVLKKMKVPVNVLKYWSVTALAILIAIMGSNSNLGIYITYIIALAISCLYFDVRFTKHIAILGYICMVIAVFFRAHNVTLSSGDTALHWFRGYTMGFTIEYIALAAVFMSICKSARKLLEGLHSSEQVQAVVDNCEEASGDLVVSVEQLHKSLDESRKSNESISESAGKTLEDCNNNQNYVNDTVNSIQNMANTIDEVIQKTSNMREVAKQTFDSTQAYIKVMDDAVLSMDMIGRSTDDTLKAIQVLEERIGHIEELTSTIIAIANQTGLLALNASIEAARAGENGRGFNVVAEEVRKLSEESHDAVDNITKHVESIKESVVLASKSIVIGSKSVNEGRACINHAKEEAEKLESIQQSALQTSEDIFGSCQDTQSDVKEVVDMASNMTSIMNHSSEMVMDIKDNLKNQEEIIKEMEQLFGKVNDVSNQLKEIVVRGS